MSTATPSASTPDVVSPTNVPSIQETSHATASDRLILEYLRARGYKDAEKAFLDAVNLSDENRKRQESSGSDIVSSDDLLKRLSIFAEKAFQPGENAFKDKTSILQELASMGTSSNIQSLIASIGPGGAEEILSLDPADKQEGFRELESWVEGSLDMYRVGLYYLFLSSFA